MPEEAEEFTDGYIYTEETMTLDELPNPERALTRPAALREFDDDRDSPYGGERRQGSQTERGKEIMNGAGGVVSHTDDARRREEEQKRLRSLLLGILDTLPSGPSDRDALAEKAMVAYLLRYAERDYTTVASYAYKMADAMIAERLKQPAQS